MDNVTLYGLLKKDVGATDAAVNSLQPGYTFQGSVSAAADLPATGEKGDLYVVKNEDNAQYVWDGTEWLALNSIRITGINNE